MLCLTGNNHALSFAQRRDREWQWPAYQIIFMEVMWSSLFPMRVTYLVPQIKEICVREAIRPCWKPRAKGLCPSGQPMFSSPVYYKVSTWENTTIAPE